MNSRASARRCVTGGLATILLMPWPGTPARAQAVAASGGSPFYDLAVLAKAPDLGISRIGNSLSINDEGTVAFAAAIPGGEGIFVTDGSAAPRNIASAFLSSTRAFGEAVQINNADRILARVRKQGVPVTYQLYRFNATDNTFTQIATGGPEFSPVDVVLSHSTINNGGTIAFPAQCFSACPLSEALLTPKVEGSNSFSDYNAVKLPIPLRPMMADDGRVVIKDRSTETIRLFNFDLATSQTIACAAGCFHPGFTRVGRAPGVDDTGTIIVFSGDRGRGPGIFASVDDGGGGRRLMEIAGERWDGAKCRPPAGNNDIDGLIGFDTAGDALCFRDVDLDSRVAVARLEQALLGIDGDRFVVAFLGTPSAASRDNPIVPGRPLLFSAAKGLFTVDIAVARQLLPPGDQTFIPRGPRKVVQMGDVVAGRTVTAITLHDPIAIPTTDDGGNLRAAQPGDHRLAFHVTTSSGDMVLRATHFDTDRDGLLDHWERSGLDVDGDGVADLDLAAMGADPLVRDRFLEIDWLVDEGSPLNLPVAHEPAPGVTQSLVDMFASRGIRLHIDAGPGKDRKGDGLSRNIGGPLEGGDRIGMPGDPARAPDLISYGSATSPAAMPAGVELRNLDEIKPRFFGTGDKWARELVFHYVVLADFGAYADVRGGGTLGRPGQPPPLQDQVAAATNGALPSLAMNSVTIPTDASGNTIQLTNHVIKITGCKAEGQFRMISANTDTTLVVKHPWAIVPNKRCSFVVFAGSSGIGEYFTRPRPDQNSLPGNDFLVTLGSWTYGGVRPDRFVQWRSIAHEFGHNLALRHCGAEANAEACKTKPADHPSLMSYAHQLDRGSAVSSYSDGTGGSFDEWGYIRPDAWNTPVFLGNSFLQTFGALPLDIDPSITLSEYFDTNPDIDAVPPSASIAAPAPGITVPSGGDLTVDVSASDDGGVASVQVSFDIDGDGTVGGHGETVEATETAPGSFRAVFAGISGPEGERTVLASPLDGAGNVGLASVEVTVRMQPLTTTKVATAASVPAGGQVGYAIAVDNPNGVAVALTSINDTLPEGFAYEPASTTGVTTIDPTIDGQTLMWPVTATVPAGGRLELTFTARASRIAGVYVNDAGGTAEKIQVTPSGPTAEVTVTRLPTALRAEPAVLRVMPPGVTFGTFAATLTEVAAGLPVAGVPVDFLVGERVACTDETDTAGRAACGSLMDSAEAVLAQGYRARFAGDATYEASAATAGLVGP